MEFTISLGLGGWIVLLAGALLIGVIAQMIGSVDFGYEWVITSVVAGFGALAASEFIVGWQTFEPVWDGLAIIPAIIGGLVFGSVAAVVTRLATGGSYFHRATAA